jgi:hypothetical protein
MFDAPVFGVADAADPKFEALQNPEAVGPHFSPPRRLASERQAGGLVFSALLHGGEVLQRGGAA